MKAEALDLTTDINGTPWAKLSELKPGHILIPDGGFTCMKEGVPVAVARDQAGALYVPCRSGGHTLDGQADDGETLVGLYRDTSGQCAGGVEIGVRACPKCGATEDHPCPFNKPQ